MMNIKTLMQSSVTTSPDGNHWEPALSESSFRWRNRLSDVWAVWTGKAVAIRQTTKEDLDNYNELKLAHSK